MKKPQGFSLIELVVVIVILAILAAIAAPKFLDLHKDAKISVLQGLEGTVKSAVNISYAKAVINGYDKLESFAGFDKDGNTLTTCGLGESDSAKDKVCRVYGYPLAHEKGIIGSLAFEKGANYSILDIGTSCQDSDLWCVVIVSDKDDKLNNVVYVGVPHSVGIADDNGSINEESSCALKYKLANKDTANKTVDVMIDLLTEGC